ncbi:MAG: type I-B CRISPR-associated endonuclease Cas1 [Bacteroidetes bacterium]|nr:MAG: type I-B CRISPR-associated endonuclease Cas1 [Bacteroidota bacterium]
MAQSLYLFRAGWLRRAQNTLLLQDSTGQKHHLPVETIRDLFAMGPLRLSASTLRFLGQKGIPVHFFTHYGTYAGTYWPRQRHTSGQLVITQVQHALDPEKRLSIARQIVSGAIQQMRKNLLYYQQRGRDFSALLDYIAQREAHLPHTQSLAELMGEEGKVRSAYYQAWQAILGLPEPFLRSRRPPATLPNALLSFLNTLLYTATLSELYHTPLHPGISFLHEPSTRRFSLALDLAEPFKPLLVDRLLFRLLNRSELTQADTEPLKHLPGVFLKEEARKKVIRAWAEQLQTTIQHRRLRRSVSYRQLLRYEAYKLMRHLLGIEPYQAFRAWW